MTDHSPATDEQIEVFLEHTEDTYTVWDNWHILSLIARIRAETAKNSGEVKKDAVDNMIDFILSDETPIGPEDQPNIDMFDSAIASAKDRLHHEAMVKTAYKTAVMAMRGTSADIGAGELDRIVRAIVSTLFTPANSRAEAMIEAAEVEAAMRANGDLGKESGSNDDR